jgi:site-specific DNA-methyltransferase (adenine-specific)
MAVIFAFTHKGNIRNNRRMIKSEDIELGGVCVKVFNDDCLNVLREMPDNSVDSIVSDPPYGISFMAKKWDYDVPSVEVWKEVLRVLKPGGHSLIACGTRTQHRMVCNIEDAGFEIRDVVSWIYGSGFPKSLNIHKKDEQCPDGWGTALKPSVEFFTLCRKPLSESTVAKNVLKWGTGGINIDGCRVGKAIKPTQSGMQRFREYSDKNTGQSRPKMQATTPKEQGRFPANLIHDGSQEVLDLFPETKSAGKARAGGWADQDGKGGLLGVGNHQGNGMRYGDNGGSASRFFYCPKASKKDRDEGLEGFEEKESAGMAGNMVDGQRLAGDGTPIKTPIRKNTHPTVKPTALMAYLCRLITPTGGVVLDPYMGSGSTGKAAVREGFSFVGIELDPDYYEICKARIIK